MVDNLRDIPTRCSWLMIFLIIVSSNAIQGQTIKADTGWLVIAGFRYQYEAGVSSRISVQTEGSYQWKSGLALTGVLRFNLNEQAGIGAVGISIHDIPAFSESIKFRTDLIHLEYPDFLTGENIGVGMLEWTVNNSLNISAGITYRSPDFTPEKIHSPFDWSNEADELYPVFNLYYRYSGIKNITLAAFTGNYIFPDLYTLDHWLLGLSGAIPVSEKTQFHFRMVSALKGLSGFVFSVNELRVFAGMKIRL